MYGATMGTLNVDVSIDDGTSWTTNSATIAGARHDGGAAGTNTAGFIMGGTSTTAKTTTTEEWTQGVTTRIKRQESNIRRI